jgi:aspartate/glutamate racemase
MNNMSVLSQRLVPGIVGISTYVDCVYQKEMQLTAVRAAGIKGPINQLRTVTVTLDFNMLVANLQAGRKEAAEEQVAVTAEALQAAGADFLVVTSGTTSTLTGRARARVSIPFLDLADAAWKEASQAGPVGLLCTSYATAGGIFQATADRHGAMLVLPSLRTAQRIDEVIFGELICGEVSEGGVGVLRDAIAELVERGAVSIILGNTDMTLAADRLKQLTPAALIDSARAHARAAGRAAVEGHL